MAGCPPSGSYSMRPPLRRSLRGSSPSVIGAGSSSILTGSGGRRPDLSQPKPSLAVSSRTVASPARSPRSRVSFGRRIRVSSQLHADFTPRYARTAPFRLTPTSVPGPSRSGSRPLSFSRCMRGRRHRVPAQRAPLRGLPRRRHDAAKATPRPPPRSRGRRPRCARRDESGATRRSSPDRRRRGGPAVRRRPNGGGVVQSPTCPIRRTDEDEGQSDLTRRTRQDPRGHPARFTGTPIREDVEGRISPIRLTLRQPNVITYRSCGRDPTKARPKMTANVPIVVASGDASAADARFAPAARNRRRKRQQVKPAEPGNAAVAPDVTASRVRRTQAPGKRRCDLSRAHRHHRRPTPRSLRELASATCRVGLHPLRSSPGRSPGRAAPGLGAMRGRGSDMA